MMPKSLPGPDPAGTGSAFANASASRSGSDRGDGPSKPALSTRSRNPCPLHGRVVATSPPPRRFRARAPSGLNGHRSGARLRQFNHWCSLALTEGLSSMVAAGNGGQIQAPQLNVAAQYIKDFSFENPNAPRSLTTPTQQPAIDIKINVGVNTMSQTDFEVVLNLEGKAEAAGEVLFSFELVYGGLFRVQNIPEEQTSPADIRMSALVVPVRARDNCTPAAHCRLSPALSRSRLLYSTVY